MTLTAKDIADLDRIESEIEQDQNAFFRFAQNLVAIRDRKLYLRDYKTFEAYCQNRWGWTRQWVYQQIKSFDAVRQLTEKPCQPVVDKPVSRLTGSPEKPCQRAVDIPAVVSAVNERTARAISDVPEAQRAAVVARAVANGTPLTGPSIRASAKKITDADEPPKRRDETGWVIPQARHDLFERAPAVERILDKLADVRGFIRRIQESSDPLFAECNASGMLMECDNLYGNLKRAIPYAVCPFCQGILVDGCMACKGRGAVSRHLWDNAIPEEMKEMRRRTLEDK